LESASSDRRGVVWALHDNPPASDVMKNTAAVTCARKRTPDEEDALKIARDRKERTIYAYFCRHMKDTPLFDPFFV
jgi:hypothetical protein